MRKIKISVLVIILSLQCFVFGDPVSSLPEDGISDEREARMAWWREARFGMFVHWGLYSGLAGTWKGEMVGDRGGMEWIQSKVKADTWEYAHEAVPYFRPIEGFADEWAKLAREAGCKYVVFTTKHHDGFALHDSNVSTYDAKDLVGRDLCKEITDSIRAEGLKVGFYHSVIDWHHPQYDYVAAGLLPHPLKEKPSPNGARNHKLYVDYLHTQAEELMSNYGDVDILWWDYSKKDAAGEFWEAEKLMDMVRSNQPNIVSNNRLYPITSPSESSKLDRLKQWNPEHGDFTTPEQHIPATGISGVDWEVCMTMNGTWGFSDHDHNWKTDRVLIRNLVDIVSKGGNYLLNIGPRGDGTIPEESLKAMATIGKWMNVNSESIYGTQASPFETPAWGRYTRKEGELYAHVFDWPEDDKLIVGSKEMKVSKAYLLADENESELSIEKTEKGLVLHLPQTAPDENVSVVKIEYERL
ncbi:alpha-L-fucosidase [Puniceicoccaceae bacterium K14]|nr:alpha-L-fucosidase [Puniceicoccaceae bacterium K14]